MKKLRQILQEEVSKVLNEEYPNEITVTPTEKDLMRV